MACSRGDADVEETELPQPAAVDPALPVGVETRVTDGCGEGAATVDAGAETVAGVGGSQEESVAAVPAGTSPVGHLVESSSPLPAPAARVLDTGTVVAIVVSVVGLGVVLWLRSRMSGGAMVRRGTGPAPRAVDAEPVSERAAALGALIREADARILELTALRDELSGLTAGPDRSREPYICDGFGVPWTGGAGRQRVVGSDGRQGAVRVSACADPVADRVYELADSGRSAVEIAGALQEHTGKVELILALRRSAAGVPA